MAKATYNTPIARPSEAELTVEAYAVHRTPARAEVHISVRDASSNEISRMRVDIPALAIVAFLAAIGTARAGESGSVPNRSDYRILGFLADNGYISGATVSA